jgi:PPP family 3-phenylpropionic acid transporter
LTETAPEAHHAHNLFRFFFFVMYGGAAFLWPYISLFYSRQNLDGVQIGVLVSIGSGVALLVAPLWGRWSDRSPRPVRLLQIALLIAAAINLIIGMSQTFLWLFLLTIISGTASSALMPLTDALTLRLADREHYGSIRLWGSVGWAVTVLLAGWLIEKTTILVSFYGFAALLFLSMLLLFLIPARNVRFEHPDTPGQSGTVRTLLGNRNLLALAGAACVWYFINAGIQSFEPLYLDQLGAGESVLGLYNTLRALVEIPVMLWADKLGRRHSPGLLIVLALMIRAAAGAAIVMSPAVPVIVIARAVDGISNAFMFVGIVVFIGQYAPNGQRSFAITIITITIMNLMKLLSGPFSGWVYEMFGAYWLYVIALGGYLIGLGVFTLIKNGKTKTIAVEQPA